MANPKLFISYSWSSPQHEQIVIDLAKELRENNGVDVILDKWRLKEGHDAVAFMEKMVTDPTIKKVAIIADAAYAKKADGRSGGVGTETQIISKEVYDKQNQDKFVAVVMEKDEAGKPCLPTYYRSRIYIDLCEADKYADNFEKLLRWIYDKPLDVEPELGSPPAFLNETASVSLGTTLMYSRVISALKENKSYASGALDEYLTTFSRNLEKVRIKDFEGDFDDAIVESIESFIPYRNEAIQLFFTIAQYSPTEDNIIKLHRFFESLIPYMNRPADHTRIVRDGGFDNFNFIIHELFLYAIAIFIKMERFEEVNLLLTQQYYVANYADYGNQVMVDYCIFRNYLRSLDRRNSRLKLKRISLTSDFLEQRSKTSGLEFKHLMQADFVLFLRADYNESEYSRGWYPDTLLYIGHFSYAFEIFARSVSKAYFNKVKCLLTISKPDDLNKLMEDYRTDSRRLPRWDFQPISPFSLLGYEQLAKKP